MIGYWFIYLSMYWQYTCQMKFYNMLYSQMNTNCSEIIDSFHIVTKSISILHGFVANFTQFIVFSHMNEFSIRACARRWQHHKRHCQLK